jgi:hypothetical protein
MFQKTHHDLKFQKFQKNLMYLLFQMFLSYQKFQKNLMYLLFR